MTPEERRRRLEEIEAEQAALAPVLGSGGTRTVVPDEPGLGEAIASRLRHDFERYSPPGEGQMNAVRDIASLFKAKDGKRHSEAGSALRGAVNSATLGFSDGQMASMMHDIEQRNWFDLAMSAGTPFGPLGGWGKDKVADLINPGSEDHQRREALEDMIRGDRLASREANPEAYMVGEIAGYFVPGSAGVRGGSAAAKLAGRHLIAPSVRQALAPAGNAASARMRRYLTGAVAPSALAGAADYAAYRGFVEGGNMPDASMQDRLGMAGEALTDPTAYAFGPALSVGWRGARGLTTAAKNSVDRSRATGRLAFAKGSLTPKSRAAELRAQLGGDVAPRTAREKAYEMVLKRLKKAGMSTDEVRGLVNDYHYNGYSSVDEMLFELAGAHNDQLAVALATVGGDAKETFKKRLRARSESSPDRVRQDIRKALGLDGEDYYGLQDELLEKRYREPNFKLPYTKQVSPTTYYARIYPVLENSPSARQAVDDAIAYAADRSELRVAGQLRELRDTFDKPGEKGKILPTQALDYIDRMLGDLAESFRKVESRAERAKGAVDAQRAIRGTDSTKYGKPRGLDPETGLDEPRRVSGEYRAAGGLTQYELDAGAEGALQFGRKAAANGYDLETLQREFRHKAQTFGVDGEDSEIIRGALVMGWLRGVEDKVTKATNPNMVIRQIYGSERQRQKLLAMLPDADDFTARGDKQKATMRRRALVGGKRSDGKHHEGRIQRERKFAENESRLVYNSQTAQRTEAVAEQGGAQDKIGRFVEALWQGPRNAAARGTAALARRVMRPGIYDVGVNRELGEMMTTSGKKKLLALLDELDSYAARGPGSPPSSTRAGPRGGAVAAAGFGSQEGGSVAKDLAMDGGIIAAGTGIDGLDGDQDGLGLAVAGAAIGARRGLRRRARPSQRRWTRRAYQPRRVILRDPDGVSPSLAKAYQEQLLKGEDPVKSAVIFLGIDRTLFPGLSDDEFRALALRERKDALEVIDMVLGTGKDRPVRSSNDNPTRSSGVSMDARAPGRAIASGLRALERRLRSPRDPRRFQGVMASGGAADMRTKGLAYIERMQDPAAAVGKLGEAEEAAAFLVETLGPEDLAQVRNDIAEDTLQKLHVFRNENAMRQDRAAWSGRNAKSARRSRQTAAKERDAAAADLETAIEDLKAWFGPDGGHTEYKTDRAKRAAYTMKVRNLKNAEDRLSKATDAFLDSAATSRQIAREKVSAPLGNVVELLDGARAFAALARRTAKTKGRFWERAWANHIPAGRRSYETANELADLLTNPARAEEAHRIATELKPLGSHEIKGQILAAGGAAAAGAGLVLADRTRQRQDIQDQRDAWEAANAEWREDTNFGPRMSEDSLREVQILLNVLLDDSLIEDGEWGPNTALAVKRYQRKRGLFPDSRLDGSTLDALEADRRALADATGVDFEVPEFPDAEN